tara:strand:- start:5879 stop:6220 length:342 start_codon:yes stop_codon:yes gene_type:complete
MMNPQENEEDIIELDQPNEINDDMLQQLHKAGQEMAKIVDDTISEIEKANAQETDYVYINTDNNPPEVRRVKGDSVPELWDRVCEARSTSEDAKNSVTIVTIADKRVTVGLAI